MSNQHGADSTQPSLVQPARSRKPASESRPKRRLADEARGYRNRPNDAVILVQKQKRPNAQKHGVFAVNPAIPGEDPREFEELHSALIEEWQPSGPTEADAVFSLADLMWRKLRAQRFLQGELIANTYDICSPSFDERFGLNIFICCLRWEPETAFERRASRILTADTISHLTQKFPRSNYQSTSEWAQAVIMEIKSVLLPAAPPSLGATGECNWPEPVRKMVVERQVAASIIYARKYLEDDLNLRERLDAMIHRQFKHLIQVKAMKEMLRQTSAAREGEQPKKIAARSTLQ